MIVCRTINTFLLKKTMDSVNRAVFNLDGELEILRVREEKTRSDYEAVKNLLDRQVSAIRALILPLASSPEGEELGDYYRRLENCILQISHTLDETCETLQNF